MKRLLALALVLTGCQTDLATVDRAVRERLNRPCTRDDVCAAVVMPCDACGCASRAILAERTAALTAMARRVDCSGEVASPCAPCSVQSARCIDGVCALVEGEPENPQLALDVRVGDAPFHVSSALAEWTESRLLLHFDLGPRACHLADDAPLSLLIERAGGVWRLTRCFVNGDPWHIEPTEVTAPDVRVDADGMLVTDLDLDAAGVFGRRVRVRGTVVAHDCAPSAHPKTPRERQASLSVREQTSPVRGALLFVGETEDVLLVAAGELTCEAAHAVSAVAGFRVPHASPLVSRVCVGGTEHPVSCHDAPRGVEVQTIELGRGVAAVVETRRARVGYHLNVEGRVHPSVCRATADLEDWVRRLSKKE